MYNLLFLSFIKKIYIFKNKNIILKKKKKKKKEEKYNKPIIYLINYIFFRIIYIYN
jgi:hypothetical protein